jgi:hypothetical protein
MTGIEVKAEFEQSMERLQQQAVRLRQIHHLSMQLHCYWDFPPTIMFVREVELCFIEGYDPETSRFSNGILHALHPEPGLMLRTNVMPLLEIPVQTEQVHANEFRDGGFPCRAVIVQSDSGGPHRLSAQFECRPQVS